VEQRATFAVLEFIDALLHGRSVQAVALYPQYCELLDLAGDPRARQRAHPADLWVVPPGIDLQALETPAPEAPDEAIESIELSGGGPEQLHVAQHSEPVVSDFPTGAALRTRLDQAVLQFVKAGSPAATCTCTSTGRASTPAKATVATRWITSPSRTRPHIPRLPA
jgi:hypothetical protein